MSKAKETKINENNNEIAKGEIISEKNHYINKGTEIAINEYNDLSTSQQRRGWLFQNKIQRPLEKLIENIIFKYDFVGLESYSEMKNDTLSHLMLNISKYDMSKGSAFSYFNTAVRNYLISKKKKYERLVPLDESQEHFETNGGLSKGNQNANGSVNFIIQQEYWRQEKAVEVNQSIINTIVEKLTKKANTTKNRKERQFYLAIVTIMETYQIVNISSSKHIHVMIRNLTDLNPKDISVMLRKLRLLYAGIREQCLNDMHR